MFKIGFGLFFILYLMDDYEKEELMFRCVEGFEYFRY